MRARREELAKAHPFQLILAGYNLLRTYGPAILIFQLILAGYGVRPPRTACGTASLSTHSRLILIPYDNLLAPFTFDFQLILAGYMLHAKLGNVVLVPFQLILAGYTLMGSPGRPGR